MSKEKVKPIKAYAVVFKRHGTINLLRLYESRKKTKNVFPIDAHWVIPVLITPIKK